jgi:hypothetical protein
MFRLMQRNWSVWVRMVTVTTASLAILFSAFAVSPEIDHRLLPPHYSVTSAVDVNAANGGSTKSTQDTNCHVGHSCALVILPADDIALLELDTMPERARVTAAPRSVAKDAPFHPPRTLSQV